MRLYIEGHSVHKGYAISQAWSDKENSTLAPATQAELQPVRFVMDHRKAALLVERWNKQFSTH